MLLNALIGKKTSKVGGLPGITRGVSWHKAGRLLVVDSPGILDPKTDRETRAMLAWLGCIRISVVGDYESLSLEFLKFMQSTVLSQNMETTDNSIDEIAVEEHPKP